MARGGKRQGREGGNYMNRSDMRSTQPVQAPSGGGYGDRKALEDAQRAMPLENAAGAQAATQGAAPPPSVMPGDLGPLNRPSDRPNEPVTAGAPLGPGPNAMGPMPTDDIELRNMAQYLPALELLASLPNTSISTRNFIRRLRGATPIEEQI